MFCRSIVNSSKFAVLLGIVVALGLVFILTSHWPSQSASGVSQSNQTHRKLLTEQQIAQFWLGKRLPTTDLLNINSLAKEVIDNRKVLLIFLTTDCGACITELQTLTELHRQMSKKMAIYAVGVEHPTKLRDFERRTKMPFPWLVDTDLRLKQSLGIKLFPTKILINKGLIEKISLGASDDKDRQELLSW